MITAAVPIVSTPITIRVSTSAIRPDGPALPGDQVPQRTARRLEAGSASLARPDALVIVGNGGHESLVRGYPAPLTGVVRADDWSVMNGSSISRDARRRAPWRKRGFHPRRAARGDGRAAHRARAADQLVRLRHDAQVDQTAVRRTGERAPGARPDAQGHPLRARRDRPNPTGRRPSNARADGDERRPAPGVPRLVQTNASASVVHDPGRRRRPLPALPRERPDRPATAGLDLHGRLPDPVRTSGRVRPASPASSRPWR